MSLNKISLYCPTIFQDVFLKRNATQFFLMLYQRSSTD